LDATCCKRRIKHGPVIELISQPYVSGMKFNSMVVNVRNLASAKQFLDKQEMEYIEIGNTVKLVGISKNVGFDFYLTN